MAPSGEHPERLAVPAPAAGCHPPQSSYPAKSWFPRLEAVCAFCKNTPQLHALTSAAWDADHQREVRCLQEGEEGALRH